MMTNDPNWRLPEVPTFTLESSDFAQGDPLPEWVRSDSGNRSPSLRWSGAPETTKSYTLTVYDPDAPTGSGFWHWAVRNIPAGATPAVLGFMLRSHIVGRAQLMGTAETPAN